MNYLLQMGKNLQKIFYQTRVLFVPFVGNNYQPKFFYSKALEYIVILIFIIKILSVALTLPLPHNIFFADITKIDLIELLNNDRRVLGINPLVENNKLNEAALSKARDMVQNNYFAHQSPQGIKPWFWFKNAGYSYKYAGENLAIGFINSLDVFNAWINSPLHKANMINPNYEEVGTAVLDGFGDNNTFVVVQLFGSPLPKNPPKNKTNGVEVNTKSVVDSKTTDIEKDNQADKTTNLFNNNQVTADTNNFSSEVLGQFADDSILLKQSQITKNSLYFKFLFYLTYKSVEILQYISYFILIFIALLLFYNIIINSENFSGDLIFKSILYISILLVSMSINKETVNLLI